MKFTAANAVEAIKKAKQISEVLQVPHNAVVTDEGFIEICESDDIRKFGTDGKEAAVLETMEILKGGKVVERMITIPFGG